MKRNIFAVCDLEVDYALNFMDYMNRKKNIPFEIQAFTSVENLIAYGKQTHIELLLISGRAMCREVRDLDIGKIIILSEGVHPPELDQYPSVYKYQSSSDVLREVMACYGAEKKTVADQIAVLKKTTEIIGIFSPLGRCLKTSFALTLGQILAKERAVLYLNMEEYSGFEELMGKGFAHNLSDLLYYVRQDNQNLLYKMNSMIQTINNLDYVPPVQMPADIRTTAWQDWERLFQMLILDSSYEVIVLDIGCGIDENFQLLDMCKKIYMPVLSDAVSQCKIAQFENLVRIWDYPQILEKTEKINPPLRSREDRDALIEGLLDGTIDMIVTDHAPHSREEKARGLEKSAMGVVGLETSFAACYTSFVKPGVLPLGKLMDLMHDAPMRRFGCGTELAIGQPADLTVFNLSESYVVEPEQFLSMGRATPFAGVTLTGVCKMTMIDGKIVWKEETL